MKNKIAKKRLNRFCILSSNDDSSCGTFLSLQDALDEILKENRDCEMIQYSESKEFDGYFAEKVVVALLRKTKS